MTKYDLKNKLRLQLSERYNLKMTKEFKQDMRKLDKLSKKVKKSN